MKARILSLVLVLLCSVSAWAGDSDTLLTADGALFTVETEVDDQSGRGFRHLVLTARAGDEVERLEVPASRRGGDHSRPALAYDAESQSLFIFWQHAITPSATELVFCSFKDGQWSEPTSIDANGFRLRRNLRIGITRSVETITAEGPSVSTGLTVHAVWWEERGNGELARYAMLTIDKGAVADVVLRDLGSFVPDANKNFDPAFANDDVLTHPVLFESADRTSVDVLFGDTASRTLRRITLKPISDGRVRIPIGAKPRQLDVPNLHASSNSHVAAVASGDRLAIYVQRESAIEYSIYSSGKWRQTRVISLGEKVSAHTAVDALRKMVESE